MGPLYCLRSEPRHHFDAMRCNAMARFLIKSEHLSTESKQILSASHFRSMTLCIGISVWVKIQTFERNPSEAGKCNDFGKGLGTRGDIWAGAAWTSTELHWTTTDCSELYYNLLYTKRVVSWSFWHCTCMVLLFTLAYIILISCTGIETEHLLHQAVEEGTVVQWSAVPESGTANTYHIWSFFLFEIYIWW